MYRYLTNQPKIVKPPIGSIKLLPAGDGLGQQTEQNFCSSNMPNEGITSIGTNDSGYEEFRSTKDGSVIIKVLGGWFWMGSFRGDGRDNERPQRRVYVDDYYIGKYPVTNEQFEHFISETNYVTDAEKTHCACLVDFLGDWKDHDDISWRDYYGPSTKDHPVVLVTPTDALEYCKWAGMRLPSEAEREKAARGTDGRKYPWGNEPEPNHSYANYRQRGTTSVGSYILGQSPYGCYDMSGNVWEWCAELYDDSFHSNTPNVNPHSHSDEMKVCNRGGSWYDSSFHLRCAYRVGDDPKAYPHVGFRCAL